jgi:hypothetical protein
MTASRTVSFQPYFGGFVLETLTVGMYGESRNAIREYVQNGFDSIQRAIQELNLLKPGDGLIRIQFDNDFNGVTIRDNGAGLPVRLAGQTLTSIGASRKDYKSDAGFRGIGRLAGIVFSETVTFRTKAAGEEEETEVVFNAAEMRRLMSPGRGSELSAEDLLTRCVSVTVHDTDPQLEPFFEVKLRGFAEAPDECTQPQLMARFVSQVAPVPYREDFEQKAALRAFGRDFGLPIEEVSIVIEAPTQAPRRVFKPYRPLYEVQNAENDVPLAEIQFFDSPTRRWWGWLGKKAEPGSYLDADVRGVRIRAKNIQIDGEGVVREIFQKRSSSTARYQDWFVGEIFVDLRSVTPNARRDGFEDTLEWRGMQDEVAKSVCREAGRSAQSISDKGQLTLQKLTEKTTKLADELEALRRSDFKNADRTIALSAEVTKVNADVARASRNADPSTQAELRHLSSQLLDVKTEAVGRLTNGASGVDRETVEEQARHALLAELMVLFEDQLPAPCLASVRNLVRDEFDFPPD